MKKQFGILGVAMLAVCAIGFMAASSAFAAGGHWAIGGTKIAEGSTNMKFIEGTATTTSQLKVTLSGTAVNITCKKADATGTVENPTGGGPGLITNGTITFTECTVDAEEVTGCVVKNEGGTNGTIAVTGLKGSAPTTGTVQFEPTTGTTFVTLVISGCSNAGVNTTAAVTGIAKGVYNSTTGELEFTETSGSTLMLGVHPAKFIAKFHFWEDGSAESALKALTIVV
jgi:hypothetical protein